MDELLILGYVAGGGAVALGYGGYAGMSVLKLSDGNDDMKNIAGAIQEGASAYMNRQLHDDTCCRCCTCGSYRTDTGHYHCRRFRCWSCFISLGWICWNVCFCKSKC